ncbi:uncharacterized protein VTP21DRAFT_9775 [Calcarisporiella thermophila]|uniref:uncharacterized protein n=1 Tax=Calcarisporiella thermophila TaxID=911321 RepID=UPI003741F036
MKSSTLFSKLAVFLKKQRTAIMNPQSEDSSDESVPISTSNNSPVLSFRSERLFRPIIGGQEGGELQRHRSLFGRHKRLYSLRKSWSSSARSVFRIDEGYAQQQVSVVEEQRIDFMCNLPYELVIHIMSFLDSRSLARLSSVSKAWNLIAHDNQAWRRAYLLKERWRVNIPDWVPAGQVDWKHLFSERHKLEQRWRRGDVTMRYFDGHTDSVYCVQFDEEKIVTGSRDRTIKIWDATTMRCLRTLEGHKASVLCLQYDARWMASGSSDTTIILWSMVTYEPIRTLCGHTAGVLDLCLDENLIVSCSKDSTIKVWRIETGQLLRTLTGHSGPVNAVQLRGRQLVSASGDWLVKLWDVETGQCLRNYSGHTRGLACIQFDGRYIVSGSNDHKIKVWDVATGQCLRTLEGHTNLVRTMHLMDTRIVTGSYDQSIRVWDLTTGECLLHFQNCHSSWVFDVQFNETRIVSTSHDKKILVMDFGEGIDTRYIV